LGSSDAFRAAVITAAVALTYPVQFYVAIAVLERAVLPPAKAVAVTGGADAMSEVKIGLDRIVALYYCFIHFTLDSLKYLVPLFRSDNATEP
jgi:hypothetical protein